MGTGFGDEVGVAVTVEDVGGWGVEIRVGCDAVVCSSVEEEPHAATGRPTARANSTVARVIPRNLVNDYLHIKIGRVRLRRRCGCFP